ncbi:ATP-dependent DNA helicase PIF1 [Trichonephila clavipes]|nr:ATP-dependent DNA helicase PIF1 [Trichonephila clavipes]
MSKQEYCHMMRSTNNGQRELILETIHRLHLSDSIPIQIFFTGPSGSGKTYVLKLLMETYNRYTQQHNSLRNAFIACASTGKAAVNLGGATVHSAFKITQSRRIGTMARDVLQNYRSTFIGVKCIIIDEMSMIGCDVLHKINLRLQEIIGVHDQPFGNLNIIFCGDLHQLPPINASPVYKGPRNSICGNRSTTIHSNRSRAWCKVNVPATVRLFHRNHDVGAYNNNAFIPEFENIADDKMIGYNMLTEVATARRNLHKMSVVESGGLPYSLKLAVGYPYMITMNLDVEDGLVNDAIGTLKYIEYLTEDEKVTIYGTTEVDVEPQPSTLTRIRKRVRLWLEFPNPSMGQLCRVKAKPHVMCKRDVLDLKWTPIVTRAANIPLGGNIKCRRNQFPVVSASAITIHRWHIGRSRFQLR